MQVAKDILAALVVAPFVALGLCLLIVAWAAWGGDLPW